MDFEPYIRLTEAYRLLVSPVDLVKNWGGGWLILAGFIAAGCWKPGASFELAAPTHLSSCLDES